MSVAEQEESQCRARGCTDVFRQEAPCQCNAKCGTYNNCCADYKLVCEAEEGPAGVIEEALGDAGRASEDAADASSTSPRPPWPSEYQPNVSKVLEFDIYRAMPASGVDMHPLEDDDVADLGGVLKYIVTEIIIESQGNPHRDSRKYGINSINRHRFKIRNPDALLASDHVAYGEFGQFVTYDWGKASNLGQHITLSEYGDFVGVQGSPHLRCDPRYPSAMPYSWFSLGNWCPNLAFDLKVQLYYTVMYNTILYYAILYYTILCYRARRRPRTRRA